MPRPIPLPSNQPVASRTNSPAVVSPRRWAPNIPGRLIRALSQRLGVDGIAAMRIALLYGDIEWQAASSGELRYSASDYARRMEIHRQTVQADSWVRLWLLDRSGAPSARCRLVVRSAALRRARELQAAHGAEAVWWV